MGSRSIVPPQWWQRDKRGGAVALSLERPHVMQYARNRMRPACRSMARSCADGSSISSNGFRRDIPSRNSRFVVAGFADMRQIRSTMDGVALLAVTGGVSCDNSMRTYSGSRRVCSRCRLRGGDAWCDCLLRRRRSLQPRTTTSIRAALQASRDFLGNHGRAASAAKPAHHRRWPSPTRPTISRMWSHPA